MRSQKWIFTLNNWTEEHKEHLRGIECVYLVFGDEVAPSTGTPHLQGVIFFKSLKAHAQVVKLIPGAWVESAKCVDESIAYAKKDGKFEEHGVEPMSRKRKGQSEVNRYETAWALAKEGKIEEVDADIRVRLYSTLKKIRMDYLPRLVPLDLLANEWIYGPTGTGKTRGALARYPGAFLKLATKWWDGYAGEDVVIIDDFDKYHKALGYELKIWGDHNPFIAETKGGSLRIRPSKIIVTSNYQPIEIWDDHSTWEPVLRRYELIGPPSNQFACIFNP